MANKLSTRAKIAWRAFSVQALALIVAMPEWYPHVETLARLYFGAEAETILRTFLAIGGIVGWMVPQKKVQSHVDKDR